jgi:BCD family chlorophyll transporter-like MFS transporter
MGDGLWTGFAGGFVLLLIFGVAIAVMGDAHHSLIAEVVEPEKRGGVISVVWTFTILSTIIASVIMSQVMPEFTPEGMQQLYNLTPLIVMGSALVGMVGIEPRLSKEEFAITQQQAQEATPQGNPISSAIQILKTNKQAAGFFAFVFVSILSIFLQDNILEPFGAEVFGMSVAETNSFQPTWGGGVLVGMLLMGALSTLFSIKKRTIALIGCIGTAGGMAVLAGAAFMEVEAMVKPSLMIMGFFTGFFNVGALSMMMDMTIEGATGLYMGMWGMAQAFGNATASFGGGALHTGFIETGLFTAPTAYMVIFGIEAIGMTLAGVILWHLSVDRFHVIQKSGRKSKLTRQDAVLAMEVDL